MATVLQRSVRREVPRAHGKPLVVTLSIASGESLVTVREKYRHDDGYTITVPGLYALLAMRAADLGTPRRVRRTRKGGRL